MSGISRNGDIAGAAIIPSQSAVFSESKQVIINGDGVTPHLTGLHLSPNMVATTSKVFVGGTACVKQGDPATCGHTSSGSNKVFME